MSRKADGSVILAQQGKVLAIYAAGGSYEAGSETEAFDLQKPSFDSWLGFIGLTEVERLVVEPTLAPPEYCSP